MTRVEGLPPSLYAATGRPAPTTPLLDGDCAADVAVVGAGFTGLSTALHLAEQGANVIVLEAREVGWGASGRNGGQINPGLKADPDDVEAAFGAKIGGRLVRFAWGAPEATFALIRRYQIECDARQGGTLRAAYLPHDAEKVRRLAEQCQRRGMPVTLLEGDAARAATGTSRYLAILRDASGGDIQPLDYARGLARAAIGLGAKVHGATPVTRLSTSGRRWSLATPRGTVTADAVVVGTNGYSDELVPNLRRSIVPVFSSIAASEPLEPAVASQIMPAGGVLYEAARITVYYRLDKSRRLLMGGRGPQRPEIDSHSLRHLTNYAQRLWPCLKNVAWPYTWNGQVAITTDQYPHVHEPQKGLYAYVGCNGRGVAFSTVLGAELAKLALGKDAFEIERLVVPIKPMPLHAFWRVGVAAKLIELRLRDRFGI
jgi:glycine/D-amino acid oxidase-like deaminating enzyme